MHPLLIGVVVFVVAVAALIRLSSRQTQRENFIRHYRLPKGLFARLQKRHPQLSHKDCELVAQGLRQFFLCYLKGGRRYVSMPSQVADDLWHEFIIYTRNYEVFCRNAFGRFLHHTPAVILAGGDAQSNAGLRRCWTLACREENINPAGATRLPLLFALDIKYSIDGGFRYVPDCTGIRRDNGSPGGSGATHCGGDFSSSSVDGSTDGFGDSSSGGGEGGSGGDSGCGGGCGGD